MDLTSMTRDELVSYALTRGIDGAEYLTRDELLRVLGGHAPKPAFASATKWLRGLLANFVDAASQGARDADPHTGDVAGADSAADDSAPAIVQQEPIRTMTMARLLVEQGHVERARLILSGLDVPHETPNASSAPVVPVAKSETKKTTERESSVTTEALGAQTLRVRWSVSARGKSRAERLLDTDGALTLRVVAIESDGAVRSRILTFGPLEDEGAMDVESLAPGATCLAAVGLSTNGRFVAIAHAPRCTLSAGMVANVEASTPPAAPPKAEHVAVAAKAPAASTSPRTITQSGTELAPRPSPTPAVAGRAAPAAALPVPPSTATPHAPRSTSEATSDAIWAVANAPPSYPAHVLERGVAETKRTSAIFVRN